MRKSDRRIYPLWRASGSASPTRNSVFVDDLSFNLDPARELGMAVVHHNDPATTVAELHELLGETGPG